VVTAPPVFLVRCFRFCVAGALGRVSFGRIGGCSRPPKRRSDGARIGLGRRPAGVRRDGRDGVGGGASKVLALCPLAVAAVAVLMTAGARLVWAARRLAITAEATCLSVCGGMRFRWSARCPSARWARGCWRWWRRYRCVAGSRSARRPLVCRCAGGCNLGGAPVVHCRGGGVGDCGNGGGLGGSPVGGYGGARMFVGERSGTGWVVHPFPIAAVAALVTAGVRVVWAVRWLAVTGEPLVRRCVGGDIWVVRPLRGAAVAALVTAGMGVDSAVRR